MSFIELNLPRKNKTEMRMVNKGVDARTTWWNYLICSCEDGQYVAPLHPSHIAPGGLTGTVTRCRLRLLTAMLIV